MSSRVLVVDPPGHEEHETPPGHPESRERIDAVRRGIAAVKGTEVVTGRAAGANELEKVHDRAHIARLRQLSRRGGGRLDDDTFVSPGTYGAACRAAGAGLAAIERLVLPDPPAAAFVVARPPGHHAGVSTSRGFCIFNNIAVATAHLIGAGQRVAVIDWDVHHGDGTQEILWGEARAFFASIHQEAHYPGTGLAHERGPAPDGLTTFNLPLPAGATGDHYLELLTTIVAPAVTRFEPDWVLVSCGFDAHVDDPLAEMALTAGDFGLLTAEVARLAPAGRTVLFLEGGYDLVALEACTAEVLRVLGGSPPTSSVPSSGGPGGVRVEELRRLLVRT